MLKAPTSFNIMNEINFRFIFIIVCFYISIAFMINLVEKSIIYLFDNIISIKYGKILVMGKFHCCNDITPSTISKFKGWQHWQWRSPWRLFRRKSIICKPKVITAISYKGRGCAPCQLSKRENAFTEKINSNCQVKKTV